jgi:hypothetical protein
VSGLTVLWAGIMITRVDPYERVSSPIFPLIIIFIIAYTVAMLFMVVYETCIDTIFLCFLLDCEKNTDGVMLASPGLSALVGKYQDKSKEKAEKLQSNGRE